MNVIKKISRPPKALIFPKKFERFGKFLVLINYEKLTFLSLDQNSFSVFKTVELEFPVPFSEINFNFLTYASDSKLSILALKKKKNGAFLFEIDTNLTVNKKQDIPLESVSHIFLINHDTLLVSVLEGSIQVLFQKNNIWISTPIQIPQKNFKAIECFPNVDNAFLFGESAKTFIILEISITPENTKLKNIIKIPSEIGNLYYIDSSIALFTNQEKSSIFSIENLMIDLINYEPLFELEGDQRVVTACSSLHQPQELILTGKSIIRWNKTEKQTVSSINLSNEVVQIFPLENGKIIAITFSEIVLIDKNEEIEMTTSFVPCFMKAAANL